MGLPAEKLASEIGLSQAADREVNEELQLLMQSAGADDKLGLGRIITLLLRLNAES